MQLTWRLLPPVAVSKQTIVVNGRTYSGAPGQALDVPDYDAGQLTANGWIDVAPSGPTSKRPAANTTTAPYQAANGTEYFDTTLNALIVFDGLTWRNPATGAAV
jgi:hypothetical protein